MNRLTERLLNQIEPQFRDDVTGHDIHHITRVLMLSKYMQSHEGGDLDVIEAAAVLHDISDHKFNGGKLDEGGEVARAILLENGTSEAFADLVAQIVDQVSFKGDGVSTSELSLEAQIVQDADRLDALGAIGISRTFAYGGKKGQAIYDPQLQPQSHDSFEQYVNSKTTSINHFHEKLLLLFDRLNTETARKIGQKRHEILVNFIADFNAEWSLKDFK